jgi:hypothetical protein
VGPPVVGGRTEQIGSKGRHLEGSGTSGGLQLRCPSNAGTVHDNVVNGQ